MVGINTALAGIGLGLAVPINDATDLQRLMVQERIGREVTAQILRDSRPRTLTLVLDELA